MIYLKGNHKYIESIDKDLLIIWKGFIQKINHFNKNNNNASDLLRDIDILIGTILEKDAFAKDELKEAFTGLSSILQKIRVQITDMDSEFHNFTRSNFAIQKEKLEQLVVQARKNLMLVAVDLKVVNLSRRNA